MKPHTCPVCNGKGFQSIYYHELIENPHWLVKLKKEYCVTCNGTGIIWEIEEGEYITLTKGA